MATSRATAQPGRRVRHTLILDAALLERAKNAAAALAGAPLYLTLGGLFDRALEAELGKLEKRFGGGKPFPRRPRPLRGGRQSNGAKSREGKRNG